jgi:hypothetical protein
VKADNVFGAHAKSESFSLLYLNPPYDSEIGSFDNQRMKYRFIEKPPRLFSESALAEFSFL